VFVATFAIERQSTMAEYTKKRRVVHDTDSDEEEGGGCEYRRYERE
jgi:hypothetical protein